MDDPFCSCHALTSSGEAGIHGGTDLKSDCWDGPEPDSPWGHRRTWIFDNVAYVRGSPPYPTFYLTNEFSRERWYGTAMQSGDNHTTLFGHVGTLTSGSLRR
jgi:hypothetical protein